MVKIETLLKITTYVCVLTGLGAVLAHLDRVYIAGFAVLAAPALLKDCGLLNIALPRWLLNVVSLLVLVPSAFRIGPENVVGPVLEGLVLLLAIKLLEEKKSRDYMQIYLICMFLLIGSTLISLGIAFLFHFLALVLLCTISLILLAYFSHDPDLAVTGEAVPKLFTVALCVCAVAIPASALFFVILPRADFPLFSFFDKVGAAKSGFSDSVSLGDVAEIQEDSTVVLRAEMPRISETDLYWRGVELDRFDGKSWKKGPERARETWEQVSGSGGTVQTIYLEPSGNRYLFALDRPVGIYPEGARRWKRRTGNLSSENIHERIRYRAVSVPSEVAPGTGVDFARYLERYLELPAGFSPAISELSEQIVKRGGDPVINLVTFLRFGKFEYSLEGLPQSEAPLDAFLFEHKRGNCEYFASALGAMLRSAGIPARLIAGYRGGYYNPAGRYYLVLQKNAHVWVEAYRSGLWVRIDPTPVLIQDPSTAYRNSIFLEARLLLDTFDYYWGKFVISYDLSRQLALWAKVKSAVTQPGFDAATAREWAKTLAPYAAAGVMVLGPVVFLLGRFRRGPEQRLVTRFLRRMEKRGYKRGPGEGLEEFSCRVREPELKEKAREFVSQFHNVFYRDRKFSAEETKRLKSRIRYL
ncbi:MAG: DUF3488 and transglutaminase-like domain-containing protein [Syntrophobacteraceae bacterium]